MSRLVSILFTVAGASALSVGGVYLLKSETLNPQKEKKLSADLGFKTLSDFKSDNKKGGECVKKYMSDSIDFQTLGTQITSTDKIDNTYFTGNSSPQSCLLVNWERIDSTGGSSSEKWKGEFRWLWTFVKGDKGMIVFTSYTPHTEEQKIIVEGGIYFLKNEGSPKSWKIEKHKEVKTTDSQNKKILDSTTFDGSFPKKGEAIDNLTKEPNKEYWEFTSGVSELSKLCKSGEDNCPTSSSQEKIFKGSWQWVPATGDDSGSKQIDQWGESTTSTITGIYGTDGLEFSGIFDSLKGSWTLENLQKPS